MVLPRSWRPAFFLSLLFSEVGVGASSEMWDIEDHFLVFFRNSSLLTLPTTQLCVYTDGSWCVLGLRYHAWYRNKLKIVLRNDQVVSRFIGNSPKQPFIPTIWFAAINYPASGTKLLLKKALFLYKAPEMYVQLINNTSSQVKYVVKMQLTHFQLHH